MLSKMAPTKRLTSLILGPALVACGVLTLNLFGKSLISFKQERTYPISSPPAFVNDPALVGSWKAIDFVKEPSQFKPGQTQAKDKLFLNHVIFKPNGETNHSWVWTKGQLYCGGDRSLSKYEIREIDGKPYLVLAWISGDVISRGEKPWYYIFERDDNIKEQGSRVIDKIDFPFVNDPEFLGTWKPVDLVKAPAQFDPGKRSWKGELLDFQLTAEPNGKTRSAYSWTKGLIIHPGDKTAARYEIKTIGRQTYLFFEWKNGDYIFRQATPSWYVMTK